MQKKCQLGYQRWSMKSNNNSKIHERNIYKNNPPNFKKLAQLYPSFSAYVTNGSNGNCIVDWKNPAAVIELTKALLLHDFGIKIELPLNQLCPTVTSRVNYILWLEDLLECPVEFQSISLAKSEDQSSKKQKLNNLDSLSKNKRRIKGVDIGTGML